MIPPESIIETIFKFPKQQGTDKSFHKVSLKNLPFMFAEGTCLDFYQDRAVLKFESKSTGLLHSERLHTKP